MAGDAGADDELAAKLRAAIQWCDNCLATHTPWIGTDPRGGSGPRLTATALVRMLAELGLGDYAAKIPIDYYATHQKVVGLLTEYRRHFSDILGCLQTGDAPQSAPSAVITGDQDGGPAPSRETTGSR